MRIILPLAAFFFCLAAREVPYVPTPHPVVEAMLDLAGVGPGDFVIDLGSGDGRIPIAAGRRGARALGVEIDRALVARSVEAARMEGVERRVRFRRQDLFATPIAEASVVTLYLTEPINLRLRPRLLTELRPGARIVAHSSALGDWPADEEREVEGSIIRLWLVPETAGGRWALTLVDGRALTLELDQRFQTVNGRLGDIPAHGRLRGDRLNLDAGGLRLDGIVEGAAIRPDPDGEGESGWSARRLP